MTEVGHADRARLLRSKRDEFNSIVTSRKRKLRQLYHVATPDHGSASAAFANYDAPTPTQAELQFLQQCDMIKSGNFDNKNLPKLPPIRHTALNQSVQATGFLSSRPSTTVNTPEPVVTPAQTKPIAVPPPSTKPTSPPLQNGAAQPDAASSGLAVTPNPAVKRTPSPAQVATPSRIEPPVPQATNSVTAPLASPAPSQQVMDTPARGDVGSETTATEDATMQEADAPEPASTPRDTTSTAASAVAKPETAPVTSSQPEAVIPPAKLPQEALKVSEVYSSPASTAQTVTTPAVRDISTDTSPDHEAAARRRSGQDGDIADGSNHDGMTKEQPEDDQASAGRGEEDKSDSRVLDGPEAQLLQESMGLDAPLAEASAAPKSSPTDPVETVTASDAGGVIEEKPSQPLEPSRVEEDVAAEVAAGQTPKANANEIPDSQDSAADRMDVDAPMKNSLPAVTTNTPGPAMEVDEIAPSTPQSATHPPTDTAQVSQRVTRVSSGAIRQKSVSEILGETPRPTTSDKAASADLPASLTPITSTPQSPNARSRSGPGRRRDKPRGQVSAVVFGKSHKAHSNRSVAPKEQKQESFLPTDDYFTPLFVQGFTQASKWMKPIEVVLNQAHKTVSTSDSNIALQDNQACRVLRRVYNLQQQDKWLLRQPKRCPEPPRQESHWDVLLGEMKWMRTDFREERKWKTAVARNLAAACADWVESTPEERKAMQVPAIIPPKQQEAEADSAMADVDNDLPLTQQTPELIAGDAASPEHLDELRDDILETVAPSAIFALQEDDVVFPLRSSPTSDRLLEELPMYGAPLKVPTSHFPSFEFDPDAHWKRPALPLNKFVEGEMRLKSDGPPRKRSRYEYEQEDEDDEDRVIFGEQGADKAHVPPRSGEVALFNHDMKPIRDRLHASHQFRPPAEYNMPTQAFYECRHASQWTISEDEELRELVRQYSYNWSFISSILTSRCLNNSGAERRTPWECFERWINLEGLPSDMQKTQYFKSYQNRIDAAQRVIMQQNQLAQQQQQQQQQQASGSNAPTTPVPRRRPSTPVRVDRRRQQKHLALFDAMRKLAKKREATAQKQQHATQTAAMRKPNEVQPIKGSIKTPRDYSLMRWERDQALAEKVAQFHQRQETQRKALLQARAQGQPGQAPGTPGAVQGAPNGNAQLNMARANVPNQLAAGQGRGRMPMQAPQAAMAQGQNQMGGLVPPMMNGANAAQMQAAVLAQQQQQQQNRLPVQNQQAEVMMQARRISEQQRQAVQLQQAQQHHGGQQMHQQGTPNPSHSPPNMRPNMPVMNGVNGANGMNGVNGVNGVNQQNYMANANAQAMMASFNQNNGGNVSTPPANGLHMPNGPAGSPRAPGAAQPQNTIAQHIAMLENQFRQKNPMLTPEQAHRMAQEHITRVMMQRQNMSQSAMNAAAGGAANNGGMPSPSMGNGMATPSPHQYAALLRQQQQQQAAHAAAQNAQQQGSPQQQQQQQHQQQQHQQQQHRSPQPPQTVQPQHHQQMAQQQQAQGTPQQQHQQLAQRATPQQASPPPPQQQQQQQPVQGQANVQAQAQAQAQMQAQAQALQQQHNQRQASGSVTPSAAS